ncbi:MAG: ATP-binding protein [Ilumatobacter sp.]
MVRVSPFPHHGPLEPAQVHGRDGVIDALVERMSSHRPTVLVGPRRYGKTSVIGCVEARLADTVTVISVDLYELRSWADLAARLDDALSAVTTPGRRLLDRVAAELEVSIGVVKASLRRPSRPDPDVTVDRLLDVIVAHARANPTVLVFDEFSSIVRVDGAAGLLRTKLQHSYQRMGLLFAGSEPSTMKMLFTDTDQPFYAQADLVDVEPITLLALTDIVDAGFDGDPPPGLASRIDSFCGGHPQRSMQLADAAWAAWLDGVEPASIWAEAVDRCRVATAGSHETRFSGLHTADQAVMRLAATNGVLFGRDAGLLALSISSAQLGRARLVERGQITETGTGVAVIDPLYADWIRRRFPI